MTYRQASLSPYHPLYVFFQLGLYDPFRLKAHEFTRGMKSQLPTGWLGWFGTFVLSSSLLYLHN
jgi:hypothetical protein